MTTRTTEKDDEDDECVTWMCVCVSVHKFERPEPALHM